MKGKLIFDLPEDDCEFNVASNSMSWALTVWDIANYLRSSLKHNPSDLDIKTLEEVQTYLFETLELRNLALDMIT